MKICDACKSSCEDDSRFCENCGYAFPEAQSEKTDTPPEQNNETFVNNTPTPANAKKFSASQVLISTVIIVIVVAVSLWGGKLLAEKSASSEIDDVQKYIDKISDYTPGVIEGNTYTSEYWNMKVDFGSKWTCAPEEELREMTEELIAENRQSAASTADEAGASGELREKYLESCYANVEFSATLNSGEKNAVVFMNAVGLYGMDEVGAKEMRNTIRDSLKSSSLNSDGVVTTKTIGGNKFEVIYTEMLSVNGYYNYNIGVCEKDGVMAILYWICNDAAEDDAELFVLQAISELH